MNLPITLLRIVLAALLLTAFLPRFLAAQFGDQPVEQSLLGESRTQHWKVGIRIQAGGPVQGLFGTVPVPTEWPEQKVRVVAEDVSPAVDRVRYRTLDNGVKQMLVTIPRLGPGESAQALVTFEVERFAIKAPTETNQFVLPQKRKLARQVRPYLGPSPYIEVRHGEIVSTAKELRDESLTAWQQVEKIYDFVREKVKYTNGPLKGALAALRDGTGDCEELTSLFIALCRANGIPARTVWVPDHCYPEFYLSDAEGNDHWFPCQAAGDRHFGSMPEQRPILQKGDSFRVPEKKERQRYVAEFLTARGVRGGSPRPTFVRQIVAP